MDKGLNELETMFQLDACRNAASVTWELRPAVIPPKYSRLLNVRQGTAVICRREEIRMGNGPLYLCVHTWLHPENARITGSSQPQGAATHT